MDLDFLYNNNLILFDTLGGSIAHGTNTPASDVDKRGVFILPEDFVAPFETVKGFTCKNYEPQINDEKNNIVYYELRRFLELLNNNNPSALEILFAPEDCILSKHPLFDLILREKEKFLTQLCRYTYSNFIRRQIEKSQGLNGRKILHVVRLLEISNEIALGKGLNVRRPNRDELLKIKNGEVSFDEILKNVETQLPLIDKLFGESNLPVKPDINLSNKLLSKIRTAFYKEVKQPV